MNENPLFICSKYGSFCSNYKNSKFRNEIKKRILAELATNNLPPHRKQECEAILSDLQVWEKHEKMGQEEQRSDKFRAN